MSYNIFSIIIGGKYSVSTYISLVQLIKRRMGKSIREFRVSRHLFKFLLVISPYSRKSIWKFNITVHTLIISQMTSLFCSVRSTNLVQKLFGSQMLLIHCLLLIVSYNVGNAIPITIVALTLMEYNKWWCSFQMLLLRFWIHTFVSHFYFILHSRFIMWWPFTFCTK